MHGDRESRWLGPAALIVFALSGCAGLIYQSIWSQYLGLYLGHAAYAQSLVLAIFMGGMAIGAWWASRRSLRWRNLLRAYALIELAIGFAAVLFHPIYLRVTGFAYDSVFPAIPGEWAVQAFKWCTGTLLILPQAILLGTTFPLMSNGLMRRLRTGHGAILGGLYFTNSLGAAAGALIATFVLLPAIGLPGAMRFGAALNLVVAIAAFLLAGRSQHAPAPERPDVDAPQNRGTARLLLIAAFITGATSFVYEIGWVRMLSLAFGSTAHAFELMLAAFIGGLAFGGLWIRRRIDGYADPLRAGGWVQFLMGLAALASLLLYDKSFDWVAWLVQALTRSSHGYALYNAATAAVAVVLMAPAAFFAGMTLPLFTFSLLRDGNGEASVGRIYAANTVGAIVGVFAAVHLLMPLLGLKLAMSLAAAGDLFLGVALLRRKGSGHGMDAPYLAALAVSGLALIATLMLARFDMNAMAGGVYRTGTARMSDSNGQHVRFYRDSKTASIAVVADDAGRAAIITNGKPDATIHMGKDDEVSPDEVTMALLAVLPLLHHADPRTAAVIGFGSGMSTDTLLRDPRLQRVDTIEIESAMVDGAHIFGKRVERAYKDPRSHIHIEDAKTYFAANRLRYDIILAEPSNPWVSGVATLFSEEFYRFIPRHLERGGLFVQWVQLYEINDELVASIVQALSKSFGDYRIYLSNDSDMIIVARADGPVQPPHADVLQAADMKEIVERVNVPTLDDISAHQLGDRRSLEPLFSAMSTRSNSDFQPFLTLEAPAARFMRDAAQALVGLPTIDLPYRRVLARLPAPPADRIVDSPLLPYTGQIHRAKRVADALREGSLPTRPGDAMDAEAIAYLRATARCGVDAPADVTLSDALIRMAGRTIPYLDPESLEGVWIDPRWIECPTRSPQVRNLLDVIASLARADWPVLQRNALALLGDHGTSLSAPARDWLQRAAMLAAIGAGDFGSVETMDREFGGNATTRNELALRYRAYLVAFARWQATLDPASLPQAIPADE